VTGEGVRCGPYELFGGKDGEPADPGAGPLVLEAEESYLVRLDDGAPCDVLEGALEVHRHGSEGTLRFGNFIGRTSLGGRALEVRSNRLAGGAADAMLDEVSAWLGSLPFGLGEPTGAAYATRREASPAILFHAFALIRDAYRRLGPHDLRAAVERILAQRHESLEHDEPRMIPLGAARHIDPGTLIAMPRHAEHLQPVPPGSPAATLPTARALDGLLPDALLVRPFTESADNAENRYVAHVLEDMIDLLRRFIRMVRTTAKPSATINLREADEIADFLDRCRRHRVLADVRADPRLPAHSTVLRRKPGYRELLRLHAALDERLRTDDPHEPARLLELRDAADIYEYWCFIRVVKALEAELEASPATIKPFKVTDLGSRIQWRYRLAWPELTVTYNDTFPSLGSGTWSHGVNSYSLRLRPDIVLRWEGGRLDLFDAKLKLHFDDAAKGEAVNGEAGDEEATVSDRFKPADLHKMHAYRDALQAASVWVLYPGSATGPFEYPAPAPTGSAAPGPEGVGAIALKPGAAGDGGLAEVLKDIRASQSGADDE
jgi:predicted component of viral defense system (DUF524 family)